MGTTYNLSLSSKCMMSPPRAEGQKKKTCSQHHRKKQEVGPRQCLQAVHRGRGSPLKASYVYNSLKILIVLHVHCIPQREFTKGGRRYFAVVLFFSFPLSPFFVSLHC